MLHGNGTQQFLRKSYLEDRRKALLDKTDYTDEELDRRHLDIKQGQGGGATNPDTYYIWQTPVGEQKVRQKRKVDIRDYEELGWL